MAAGAWSSEHGSRGARFVIVKVYPTKDNRWGLFLIDGDLTFLVGVSKHSFDVDLAAEKLGNVLRSLVDDPAQIEIDHQADCRAEIMALFAAAKKEKK